MKALKTLRSLALSGLVLATLAAPSPVLLAQSARAQEVVRVDSRSGPIRLGVNKSIVVDLGRPAGDVLVSNPEIADAVLRTATRLYIIGVKVGQTNIFVFDQAGREIASFDVLIETDLSDINRLLAEAIPNGQVRAEAINGNIVLRGEVPSASDSARAEAIALGMLQGASLGTDAAGGGGAGSEQKRLVNLITITGGEQVMLKVTIAEVRREVTKQLGINTEVAINSLAGPVTSTLTGTIGGLGAALTGVIGIGDSSAIATTIEALEGTTAFRVLAEPSLTAVSGETADFLVGGEFPFSVCRTADDGDRVCEIEYKPFGVGLAFTPVVLGPGRISLKMRAEVSEITGFFNLDADSQIPILGARRAESTVELPSGGAFMLAGLIKEDHRRTITGVPGLLRLPIIGALFSSKDFQRNETELVIIVTPYLVKPVARNELKQPDDNLVLATDAEAYFLGRINKVYGTKAAIKREQYHGHVGFSFD